MRKEQELKVLEFDQTEENLNEKFMDNDEEEIDALDFFYEEMLCNYDEEEIGEIFDGYDD